MTAHFRAAKPVLLIVAILLALIVTHVRAEAAATRTAVVAGGCFWCVESDFESVPGVSQVISGFAGGALPNPTYKQVSRGGTGHRESAQIFYDPDQISYARLMYLFFRSVDPTDAGGQFCDRGESYTTAIFTSDPEEIRIAKAAKAAAAADLGQTIVTPILPAAKFYPAEPYHQDYYKSQGRLWFSRVGVGVRKSTAYKRYRKGCGRDQRVTELWGDAAPFASHH